MNRETGNSKFLGALIRYINFLFSINFLSDSVYWDAVSIDSYYVIANSRLFKLWSTTVMWSCEWQFMFSTGTNLYLLARWPWIWIENISLNSLLICMILMNFLCGFGICCCVLFVWHYFWSCAIQVAVFYFHDEFTWLKGAGLFTIMIGVSLFNWYK